MNKLVVMGIIGLFLIGTDPLNSEFVEIPITAKNQKTFSNLFKENERQKFTRLRKMYGGRK